MRCKSQIFDPTQKNLKFGLQFMIFEDFCPYVNGPIVFKLDFKNNSNFFH